MPRHHILTERQRKALFDLPADEGALLRHYTLDDDDIEHIRTRRHAHNKLGFALQLCAFRYPGRLLTAGEVIPLPVTEFLAAQIGVKPHELAGYAETEVTRRRHLIDLRCKHQGNPLYFGFTRGAIIVRGWRCCWRDMRFF
jgi:TnpA family transposase